MWQLIIFSPYEARLLEHIANFSISLSRSTALLRWNRLIVMQNELNEEDLHYWSLYFITDISRSSFWRVWAEHRAAVPEVFVRLHRLLLVCREHQLLMSFSRAEHILRWAVNYIFIEAVFIVSSTRWQHIFSFYCNWLGLSEAKQNSLFTKAPWEQFVLENKMIRVKNDWNFRPKPNQKMKHGVQKSLWLGFPEKNQLSGDWSIKT